MLKYLFSNCYACVEFGGCLSNKWRISEGVRQGGFLSAFLFIIYMNSILEDIDPCERGCRIGVTKRNIHAYAADVVLFCPTSSGLQKLIDGVSAQCDSYDLVINYDKTKVIKFGK